MPKQIASETEAVVVQTLGSTMEMTLTAVFSSNLVLTVFASIAMYFLWGMINGLQLIALTCLFKIRLPSNVMSVNIEILKIAAFDLFQSDWFLMKIFRFSDTPSISPEF